MCTLCHKPPKRSKNHVPKFIREAQTIHLTPDGKLRLHLPEHSESGLELLESVASQYGHL